MCKNELKVKLTTSNLKTREFENLANFMLINLPLIFC